MAYISTDCVWWRNSINNATRERKKDTEQQTLQLTAKRQPTSEIFMEKPPSTFLSASFLVPDGGYQIKRATTKEEKNVPTFPIFSIALSLSLSLSSKLIWRGSLLAYTSITRNVRARFFSHASPTRAETHFLPATSLMQMRKDEELKKLFSAVVVMTFQDAFFSAASH